MADTWCLYKHTSPSGKVYIGIAKDVKHRWRANGNGYKGSTRIWYAIQKYGWENFTHEIIAENLTREEASELEKKTIAEYNSTDTRFGYNLTSGGYDGVLSEESLEKLSHSLTGHPVSDYVKKVLRDSHIIPVICLETLETFDCAASASMKTGIDSTNISKCCNGKAGSAGGYHFAKLSDYENGTIPEFKPKPKGRPVLCVETGEKYKNQTEAAKAFGVSSQAISHACTGKVETSAKMHWKFIQKEDDHGKRKSL